MADALTSDQQNLDSEMRAFLSNWSLPSSLLSWIQNEIVTGATQDQILSDIRLTPEYKQAFPEQAMRVQNGFGYESESNILGARSEIKRLSQQYFGYTPSAQETANVIGNDVSMTELEQNLQTVTNLAKYGDTVKNTFFQEAGVAPTDEETYLFMHPEVTTPQMDRMYESALMRGRPAQLGLGVRPQDEANVLMQYGLTPDQAFTNYQKISQQLPAAQRFQAIEDQINKGASAGKLPAGAADALGNTPFATLFRAVQLGDQGALQELRAQMAHEVARFQSGGGSVSQSGQQVGLLTPGQRAQG